jgi:S-adenosylmethionine synthetase
VGDNQYAVAGAVTVTIHTIETETTMTHTSNLNGLPFRFAEAVLPGHPDKLSDQIADAIVDIALARDPRAIVQVEVAVHQQHCHLNGRCSTTGEAIDRGFIEATVRGVYRRAGFGVPFAGVGDGSDYQCPTPDAVRVDQSALVVDVADENERGDRELCDDQAIHVGYAVGTPETRWLPLEQHLALRLRDALLMLCVNERVLGAGPDGKVLVALEATGDGRYRPAWVVSSVQHLAESPVVQLERAVRECFLAVLEEEAQRCPHLLVPPTRALPMRALPMRINESGIFVEGGPINDNGQTGRKLVCDFYGPHVSIGGGALSGKDPWRLDRAGALRARQIAVAMVETGFVREAKVTFAWGHRDRRPSGVLLEADGRVLETAAVRRWLTRFDPSLAATHEELGLAAVNWENCARAGHFGRGLAWEASAS